MFHIMKESEWICLQPLGHCERECDLNPSRSLFLRLVCQLLFFTTHALIAPAPKRSLLSCNAIVFRELSFWGWMFRVSEGCVWDGEEVSFSLTFGLVGWSQADLLKLERARVIGWAEWAWWPCSRCSLPQVNHQVHFMWGMAFVTSLQCPNREVHAGRLVYGFFSWAWFIFLLLQMEKIRPNFKACASAELLWGGRH